MLTNEYVAAVFDLCGCFYECKTGGRFYERFRIVTKDKAHKVLMDKIARKLKKEKIVFQRYDLKKDVGYYIIDRSSMKNLKKFIKEYGILRKMKGEVE